MAGQHEIDGRQRPYPAETANRWVSQLKPVLLDFPDGDLRPIHELVGEYYDKVRTFLYPDPVLPRTRLGGAFPEVRSRRAPRDNPLGSVEPLGVERFKKYAHLGLALRALDALPSLAPDGQWLTYTEEDFFHDWGYSPWDAEDWIEQNARGLRLRRLDRYQARERDRFAYRRRNDDGGGASYVPVTQILEHELEQQRLGKGTVLMAGIAGGTIAVVASACAPVTPSPQPTRVPTFPSPSPEATRTPKPFSLLEATPTLESRGFTPPVNPPEYLPQAAGGAFPESIREVAELDFYRALETLYRQEEGPFLTTNLAEYQEFLRSWATQNRLEVRQVWNGQFGDRYQLVSAIIKRLPTAREAVYWYATPGGALSARPDIPSTAESTLVPVELPIGTHADFRWNNEDRHVYLFAVDNRTDEAVNWFNSTIADAARVDGLAQAFESVVKEVLPTSCLVPEVNSKIIAEYLAGTQYRTLQEAMDAWRNSDFNPRITRGGLSIVTSPVQGEIYNPKWYIAYEMKVLGGYRFSIADQSGYRDGDYAICIIAASPHMGEIVAPIVIGVQRNDRWSQVTSISDGGTSRVQLRELPSGNQAEAWVQEMRGKVIFPLIALRFDKPDWERDPLWHFGYDSILPLLRNPDGYIMRYTNNPSELGSPLTFPDGKPAGEQASLTRVIRELNPDLSGDIGLFTFQITVRN